MEPLDLRLYRPRSPYLRLAGVAYTARAIDKLRASLPGGELNGYFPFSGFSTIWQRATKISLEDMRATVADAADEATVVAWIDGRLDAKAIDRERCSLRMEGARHSDMPEAWRADFEALYAATLRERYPLAFDLFEADDDLTY